MSSTGWNTLFWPEGIGRDISDCHHPLTELLEKTARQYPESVYTIFNGAVRTYAEVKDTSDRVANFLAGRGIVKGDRIAVSLTNIPHFPEIFFGILKAGGICVPCNPLCSVSKLHHQLADSAAGMIFCMDHPVFYKNTVEAVKETQVESVIICNIKSYLPKSRAFIRWILGKIPKAEHHEPGHLMFDDVVAQAAPTPPPLEINPNDAAVMFYTGVTNGVPKGTKLTHYDFVFDVMAMEEHLRLVHEEGGPEEALRHGGYHTYLGILPWFHCLGITIALLWSVISGSKLVCIPDPRAGDPPFTEALKAVQKYRVTIMPAVPKIFTAFTNHRNFNKCNFASLMCCFSVGSSLPSDDRNMFEEKTGAVIFEGNPLGLNACLIDGAGDIEEDVEDMI